MTSIPIERRIEAIEDELRALRDTGMGTMARRARLERQLRMLTEDQRTPMPKPRSPRKFT